MIVNYSLSKIGKIWKTRDKLKIKYKKWERKVKTLTEEEINK